MLRPIDVIFKHPVKKFTVIYQNGKLWQLPRLDFTGKSLLVKKPYKDSREQIFVAQNQTLDSTDFPLIAELLTVELPPSVVGRNVNEFEAWWQSHALQFQEEIHIKEQQRQHAKQLVEQAHLTRVSPNELFQAQSQAQTVQPVSPSSQPQSQIVKSNPPVLSNPPENAGDIFDQMLAELTQPFHK